MFHPSQSYNQYGEQPYNNRDFPQYVVGCLSSLENSTQLDPSDPMTKEMIDEYILHNTPRRILGSKIKELQLLEILCGYFSRLHKSCNHKGSSIFMVVFSLNPDIPGLSSGDPTYKLTMLAKLVSLAVSTSCEAVLEYTAKWMQAVGCTSHAAECIITKLVDDYCTMVPDAIPYLERIVGISQMFTCQLLRTVTGMYPMSGQKKISSALPRNLLEIITEWIYTEPSICLESLKLLGVLDTPIAGLIGWTVLPPKIHTVNASGKILSDTASEHDDQLFSKLHLSVLQTMLHADPNARVPKNYLKAADFVVVMETLIKIFNAKQRNLDSVNVSLDRLAQSIQVAKATKALTENISHLRKLIHKVPQNKLLSTVLES